jgi:sortase A
MRKTGPGINTEKRRAVLRCTFVVLLASGLTLLAAAGIFHLDALLYQRSLSRRFQAEQSPARAPDAASEHQKKAGSWPSHLQVRPISSGEAVARLEIPRLGISVMVLEGVDAGTLQCAVGHIPGTSLPGPAGNVGLAGHRDTFFRPLKGIRTGDEILLTTTERTYAYRVRVSEVVEPRDTWVLAATEDPTLTLITCYPFSYLGPAPKRFVVQARGAFESSPAAPQVSQPQGAKSG